MGGIGRKSPYVQHLLKWGIERLHTTEYSLGFFLWILWLNMQDCPSPLWVVRRTEQVFPFPSPVRWDSPQSTCPPLTSRSTGGAVGRTSVNFVPQVGLPCGPLPPFPLLRVVLQEVPRTWTEVSQVRWSSIVLSGKTKTAAGRGKQTTTTTK